jgi:hypothetical protein
MSKNMSHPKQSSNSTMPNLSEGQLEILFRRLNLAHTRRIYQDLADRAEKENWGYRDFLALLLAEEVAHRKQTRLQRFTRKANFPFFKTIDESTSVCRRHCVCPCSVPTSGRILSARVAH